MKILEPEQNNWKNKELNIKPIDALHIACAETSKSDYFITCDKRLINRCQDLSLKVINPTDLILEIEDDN
ncbi:PIN domain-containing protein [Anabaena sp. PCC 7108]|uniref:PIN domain-containing protein n=1 Tax=Anabaena sp. PCC 7108 TaxID=163908 RepID=UPI000348EAB5|nr:PIN domain-containing protein [Anabaena sp. PCC 7108]